MDGKSWSNFDEDINRCLVVELDYDRTVVCGCDKYLTLDDSGGDSSTTNVGLNKGLTTETPAGFNLCDNGRDYTSRPRTSTEVSSMGTGGMKDLENLLNCHLPMTNPQESPTYGDCDHLQQRTPAPTPVTLAPTVLQSLAPTDAPACTCTTDASIDQAFYEEETIPRRRIIRTNGIPNHVYHHNRDQINKNPVCLHPSQLSLPLSPELYPDGFSETGMGIIGVLKTGAFLHNHKSNRNGINDVANHPDNEQPSLDECHGHAGGTCTYHYHEISQLSSCTHDGEWESCELIWWLRDGFPFIPTVGIPVPIGT